jgi:hypothetical protein
MLRLLAALIVVLAAAPAAVAAPPAFDPPFGAGYWSGFVAFWGDWFKNRNAVLFTVLIVGAVAIFIITRGKKFK